MHCALTQSRCGRNLNSFSVLLFETSRAGRIWTYYKYFENIYMRVNIYIYIWNRIGLEDSRSRHESWCSQVPNKFAVLRSPCCTASLILERHWALANGDTWKQRAMNEPTNRLAFWQVQGGPKVGIQLIVYTIVLMVLRYWHFQFCFTNHFLCSILKFPAIIHDTCKEKEM